MGKNLKYMIVAIFIIGCQGEDGEIGPSGLKSLIKTTNESSGTNCQLGGLKIDSGLDNNANGILDGDEITDTKYICSQPGKNSLITTEIESSGDICENGGIIINTGIDINQNDILDVSEIQTTRYVCNGSDGVLEGFDKQIRLKIQYPLNNNAFDWYGTSSSMYEFAGIGLIDFNKTLFVGVDSIIFTSNLFSYGDADAYVELYDATNNASIGNSEIKGRYTFENRIFTRSEDIYEHLPETTLDLGIRVKSEINGITVASGTPYLILYRSY